MNVFEKICLLMVDNGFSFRSNRLLEEQLNLASEIKTAKEKNILSEILIFLVLDVKWISLTWCLDSNVLTSFIAIPSFTKWA